jgi:hypothetical protein
VTESQFQAKLLRALRAHPALKDAEVWKMSDRFRRGVPDVVIVMPNGRVTWWELKVAPNKLTKIQSYYLTKLRLSWCVIFEPPCAYTIRPQGVPVNSCYFDFSVLVRDIVTRCVGD